MATAPSPGSPPRSVPPTGSGSSSSTAPWNWRARRATATPAGLQLQGLQLKAGEIDALGEERARLANRGRLAQGAQTALAELYENEAASAHAGVSRALQALRGLAALDGKLAAALPAYRAQAQELAGRRAGAAAALARDISARMQTLGMSGGRFEADVTQQGNADPTEHGIDQIEFRVSANPGQPPRALAKVASGGELARLSLAVQVACSADATRCMVFDEVDAG